MIISVSLVFFAFVYVSQFLQRNAKIRNYAAAFLTQSAAEARTFLHSHSHPTRTLPDGADSHRHEINTTNTQLTVIRFRIWSGRQLTELSESCVADEGWSLI